MYLLDSDVCIEFMRGRLPEVYERFQKSEPSLYGVSAVVYGELMTGAAKSRNPEGNRFMTECFAAPFEIVPFDKKCAEAYATVRADLEGRGCKIGPKDMMIAATALANSAVLVTNNVGEFGRVKGLQIEQWGEVDL